MINHQLYGKIQIILLNFFCIFTLLVSSQKTNFPSKKLSSYVFLRAQICGRPFFITETEVSEVSVSTSSTLQQSRPASYNPMMWPSAYCLCKVATFDSPLISHVTIGKADHDYFSMLTLLKVVKLQYFYRTARP